jgi:hypothetical protein
MNLKIVAVGMLMSGVMLTGLLSTGAAEAQKMEPKANMQHFTADEQRAAIQSGHGTASPMMLAEATTPGTTVATTVVAGNSSDPSSWNIPAAVWLAAAGFAGMGLLQRRKN